MLRIRNNYFLYLVLLFIIAGCAKVVTPTGGPKDVTPPAIKSSKPENYSTNFKSKDVNITFDEYIQLKDLPKNLIISPPLKEKPIIRVKGKSLIIKFESELKDSTTYNLYFGDALQDFNEGNPYKNFQYVFSTGSSIDSLSIEGQVLNAFDITPAEDVFVMLYSDLADSVPYKQIPEYLSKTDKKGKYRINNIRHGEFKLFALRDANNNYRFDVNSEEIAFIDTLVTFELKTLTRIDTVFKTIDFNEVNSKSSQETILKPVVDTIIKTSVLDYPINDYTLLLFTEDYVKQYLKNYTRDKKYRLEFVFSRSIKDSVVFQLVDNKKAKYLLESNAKKDSLIFWLRDTTDYNKQELVCALSYQTLDSAKNYYWKTDTLKMRYIEDKKVKGDAPEQDLKVSVNIKNRSTTDLDKDILLTANTPIRSIDTSKIELFSIKDSIETKVPLKIKKGKNKQREYLLSPGWVENTRYRLEISPSAIKDIYGNISDTLITEFTTQKLDYYGKLLVDIKGIKKEKNVIVQLISADKKSEIVVAEKHIKKDEMVEFAYLPPKEFLVKLIFDKNGNKIWDTGNYLKNIQPEEVLYYEKSTKIRSNWDIEISIDLTKRK